MCCCLVVAHLRSYIIGCQRTWHGCSDCLRIDQQFIGIAIDQKSKVLEYAKEMGMNYPVLLGDLAGIDLAKRIGNEEGGLP